ncbi:ketimine reductase mu-crystallin [Holotrichia oblita]|uniref:Ketimine reductase mu-crystallin n=2 Tax=Holotrichia oblita TaxID=644536 RepID=A0ACB9SP74_HOLOL|nr:ketimine reductase mu-crystallin [Holotrichia oblita]KAI4456637.1 ketimine reductase mu-crystallin [Holotrichia oblita]
MAAIKQITREAIAKILDWNSVISAVEEAMVNVSERRAVQNLRSITAIPKTDNILFAMPGYLNTDKSTALGCKLVTLFPNNAQRNLPSILANILLFNENTGVLEVIMDGTEITAWRTAAASVAATKYMRDVNSQYKTLAIVGAGTQAKIHAIAFQHQFKFVKVSYNIIWDFITLASNSCSSSSSGDEELVINMVPISTNSTRKNKRHAGDIVPNYSEEVHIWNRTYKKGEILCEELHRQSKIQGTTKEYTPFQNLEECIKDADVIITTTSSPIPLVQYKWLKPGVHINAVGVGEAVMELDEETYKSSVVFIDHLAGVEHELRHLAEKGVVFQGEIGSIINGTTPRPSSGQITIFQSLGT